MIYLIRHGLDDEEYVGGWSNKGLIETGRKQINDSITYLKNACLNIDFIITSDIERAFETARMISGELNLPLKKTPILRELNKGDFTGVLKKQIEKEYPNFLDNVAIDTIYPNGESQITFSERIQKDLDEILDKENVLLVTHRGVINEIYRLYHQDELSMDKKRYNVNHGSIHALDKNNKIIKKIY